MHLNSSRPHLQPRDLPGRAPIFVLAIALAGLMLAGLMLAGSLMAQSFIFRVPVDRNPVYFAAMVTESFASGGSLQVDRAGGQTETLENGDSLWVGDRVRVSGTAALIMTFRDGSQVYLSGPNGDFTITEMYQTTSARWTFWDGLLILTSGLIASSGPDAHQIDTPFGTLGIRGTLVVIDLRNKDAGEMEVTLLPEIEEDGTVTLGEVAMLDAPDGTALQVIDGAYEVLAVRGAAAASQPGDGAANSAATTATTETGSENAVTVEYGTELQDLEISLPAAGDIPTDDRPDAFSFPERFGALPGSEQISRTVALSGFDGRLDASVAGETAAISLNGGDWVTSGTVVEGDTLALRVTAPAAGQSRNAILRVGGREVSWVVRARAEGSPSLSVLPLSPSAFEEGDSITLALQLDPRPDRSVPVKLSLSDSAAGQITGLPDNNRINFLPGETGPVSVIIATARDGTLTPARRFHLRAEVDGNYTEENWRGLTTNSEEITLTNDEVGLVMVDGAHEWSDGNLARSCKEYRSPPEGYLYAGSGEAIASYRILDDDDDPRVVTCDMQSDGGGWTRVVDFDANRDGCRTSSGTVTDNGITFCDRSSGDIDIETFPFGEIPGATEARLTALIVHERESNDGFAVSWPSNTSRSTTVGDDEPYLDGVGLFVDGTHLFSVAFGHLDDFSDDDEPVPSLQARCPVAGGQAPPGALSEQWHCIATEAFNQAWGRYTLSDILPKRFPITASPDELTVLLAGDQGLSDENVGIERVELWLR